jgi:hypothetical protein
MLLLTSFSHPKSMENESREPMSELVEDLCQLYQEQERARALSLDVSNLMLSSGDRSPREWVQVGDSVSVTPKP